MSPALDGDDDVPRADATGRDRAGAAGETRERIAAIGERLADEDDRPELGSADRNVTLRDRLMSTEPDTPIDEVDPLRTDAEYAGRYLSRALLKFGRMGGLPAIADAGMAALLYGKRVIDPDATGDDDGDAGVDDEPEVRTVSPS